MSHTASADGTASADDGAAAGRGIEHAGLGQPRVSRSPAILLLVFTLWQSFFTTGIIYGWPALLLILLDEGVYAGECRPGVQECHERTVALNLVFSLGAMTNVAGGVFIGALVDRLGPKRSFVSGITLNIAGSLIMATASAESRFTWPVAFVAYGLGGTFAHMPSFSLGNAFGPAKGVVMSCLVGMFALSALAFQVARSLHRDAGLSREAIFLAYVAIQACNICGSLWLWPATPIRPGDTLELMGGRLRLVRRGIAVAAATPAPVGPAGPGTCAQVFRITATPRFLAFGAFHTAQLWFSRCLMGWFASQLAWKNARLIAQTGAGLDEHLQIELFNATQALLGLTAIPLFGWLVARFGHTSAPFLATSFLSVLWLACSLVTGEWALYLLDLFSGWHRQLFFSTFVTFLAMEFPIEFFGKLAGLTNFAAGLLSFTQNPLLELVLGPLHGNFGPLITMQLALAALIFTSSMVAAAGGAGGCRRGTASSEGAASEGVPNAAGSKDQAATAVAAGGAPLDSEEAGEREGAAV